MQESQQTIRRNCYKDTENYNVYVQLIKDKFIDIVLLSKLDDSIFHVHFANQSMTQSCMNLFGDVKSLYQFVQCHNKSKQWMSISDIGMVTLTQVIQNKGKQIKVQGSFQANKITQLQGVNHFYLKIIKFWEYNSKKNVSIFQNQKQSKNSTPTSNQPQKNIIKRNFQYQKRNLTVDVDNNPFLKSFSKHRNTVKIQQYVKSRIKLFFYQSIKINTCAYFQIRLVKTKANIFCFGIIDRKQKRDSKSLYSICYDFHTGDLKDSNYIKEKAETRWRNVGRPINDLRNAVARMQVNMNNQKISFYCNNQWVCETVITNYMTQKEIIPYISVKHQGDQFLLNDQ